MKEVHVVVIDPHGSQHLVQWWQKCYKLHLWSMCAHWDGCNIRNRCLQGQWNVCTHIKGSPQLKDVVVQTTFEVLWRKLGKIIKRLGRLVEL